MTNFYELIDDFKAGKLSGEVLIAFKTEMKQNEELREAVGNQDVMDQVLDYLWEDDMRQVIEKVRKKTVEEEPTQSVAKTEKGAKVIGMRRLLTAAASVVALVAFGFLLKQNLVVSQDEFYALHELEPLDLNDISMGDAEKIKTLSVGDRAHLLMDQKKFKETTDLLETEALTDDDIQKAQYLMVLSYHMQDRHQERDSVLQIILSAPGRHIYKPKAQQITDDLK